MYEQIKLGYASDFNTIKLTQPRKGLEPMDRCIFIFFTCLFVASTVRLHAAPNAADGATRRWHESLADDASLHDVAFVDAEHGWAVGDHGTILHTTDGGAHWQVASAPVDASLRGVSFVDREHGWIVGGTTSPYLWTSEAVILITADGGKTWHRQLALLPALERVIFFDAQHGVAWGRGSGGDPLGIFASDDGGRNWRPVAVGVPSAWSDGDFLNIRTGIVIGPTSGVARIDHGDAMPFVLAMQQIGAPRAVRLNPTGTSWLVGSRGLIQKSVDAGVSWQEVSILPVEIRESVNWRTVATRGSHIWIAGEPGTVVLHSADNGKTWQGHATDHVAPINRLAFVDETYGWAVGEMEAILATRDGGQTWQAQRGGSRRAAAILLADNLTELPLETVAKLSGDGYRTVIHFPFSVEGADPTFSARLAEAMAYLGANAVTIGDNTSSTEPGLAQKREGLAVDIARQLRIWRPSVVVIPSQGLLTEVAEEANSLAGNEGSLTELDAQLALPAWQVSRVFEVVGAENRGTHRVNTGDDIPLRQQTLGELATSARSLFEREFTTPSDTNEYRLISSLSGELTGSIDDLASGLSLVAGGEARRPSPEIPLVDPQTQRRQAEKRRNLSKIFRFAEGNPALLGQIGRMIDDLSAVSAAALLFEVAAYFEQTGQIDLAATTRELLVRRYTDSALCDATLVWLVKYYASSETAYAYRQVATEISQALAEAPPGAPPLVQPATALDNEPTTEAPRTTLAEQRFQRALQMARVIAQTRPLLYSEPSVRVPWAVAERKQGSAETADRYFQALSIRALGDPWQECGAVERWLAETNKPVPMKPRVSSRFTNKRPHLDGRIEEDFWQSAVAIQDKQCEVRVAHDDKFLYFVVRCEKLPGVAYTTEVGARTYDADLSGHDRVRILLDVDRDYSTYFSLMVDHRGWTNDACWRDKSWNPKWFVAAVDDAGTWNVEAAIPWEELVGTLPEIGQCWAISCQRMIPSDDTLPNRHEVGPQDFGLLLFK